MEEASLPKVLGVGQPGTEATVISGRPPADVAGRTTSMAEIGRVLEGRFLGPYRLDRFVGGGGMGAVFRALDTTLDRIVAVKVLSRQQSDDEEMLRRFRNEAQSAARLDHENIGRVHAVGSDDGWHYIVFEFIEGTNLRDAVAKIGPFDLGRAIDVTIQVADALEHASQRDVVHRDIKPSNIIITPAGRARIVDMGLARLHHVAGDQDLTVSGMTLGTFDYISPEQARDPRSADVRSDLYSLGCTMFFMLAGRPPFAEGTMVQKLLQHQQDPPPPIESFRPDVPRRLAVILGRLMEKLPENRYQRPAELVADLVEFAADQRIDLSAPRPASVAVVEPRRRQLPVHLPWLVPLLGLVLVVGGLWLMRGQDHRRRSGSPETGPAAVPNAGVAADRPPPVSESVSSVPRRLRVVDAPSIDDDCGTVAEAVHKASDGDVIEIATAEPRDEGPLTIAGKRLTIRAAEGVQPTLRFGDSNASAQDGGHWTVVSGTLEISDVTIRPALFVGGGGRSASIGLRGDSVLACERVSFMLPGIESGAASICIRSESDVADAQEVRFTDCRVAGGAAVVDAKGPGKLDVTWIGGRAVTTGRFLVVNGGGLQSIHPPSVRLSLDEGLFACGEGFACLLDGPASPRPPLLNAFARNCRFLVPEGHSLLEQSGVGDPDGYRPLIDWSDAGCRYEGSGVWRRIDGAAERVELEYASQPQRFEHVPRIEEWPAED